MMERLFTKTSVAVLLCFMASLVLPAGIRAQQDASNVIRVEQLIRRQTGGRLQVRTYATIVVPAAALQNDEVIIAELDLDSATLTISPRNGPRLTGRVSVEVNCDRFPSGLSVRFAERRSDVRPRAESGRVIKFTGTISNIDARRRVLSVESATDSREFAIPTGFMVTRQENARPPRTVALEDLGIGDEVTITLPEDGDPRDVLTPQAVEARYRMVSGVVRSSAARRIVLNPNAAYSVNPNVYVFAAHGDELEMADLRAGQRVTMRLNPATNEVWEISLGNLKGAAIIQSLSHDAAGDLRAGEVLTVTLMAPSGGTATFDLEGIQTGVRMMESPTRGTYTGAYVIPNRALPASTRVIASFTSADGRKETRVAEATPRFIGSGRFEAPRLTSPQDGEEAGSTIVLKGQTAPNARVTIKITYLRRGLLGDTKGAMPDMEVKADARGNFETQPIALRGPRIIVEESVDYTIRCVATRADGKQSEEAVVMVVRK